MKVYVVVRDELSDRYIDRVFTDKDKAELYLQLIQNTVTYDYFSLEEFDTSDDMVLTSVHAVSVSIKDGEVSSQYKDVLARYRSPTCVGDDIHYTTVENSAIFEGYGEQLEFKATFVNIPSTLTEEEAITKYEKIALDLCAKAKHMHEVDGVSIWDIGRMIREIK